MTASEDDSADRDASAVGMGPRKPLDIKSQLKKLPKPKDFEYSSIVGTSDQRFVLALERLNQGYRRAIGDQLSAAAEQQQQVVRKMLATDKFAARVAAGLSGSVKTSHEPLTRAVDQLEQSLSSIEATIRDVVEDLYAVDQQLPPRERLLAPHFPHRTHYPLLHQLVLNESGFMPSDTYAQGSVDVQAVLETATAEHRSSSPDCRSRLRDTLQNSASRQ